MDKWDKLTREIVDYLEGTWLLTRAPAGYDVIQGSTEKELEAAEQQIGTPLPKALRAWYKVAGKVPPYLNDHDADFSLKDLLQAQKTAKSLTMSEHGKWKLTRASLPFSQRMGDQFLMVHSEESLSDDPPVFHFMDEEEYLPRRVAISFSAFIRETWLEWLDFPAWSEENKREAHAAREKGHAASLARIQVINALRDDVTVFRQSLVERVHFEDVLRGEITGPQGFQERWITEFSKSDIWKQLQAEGLRFPYHWTQSLDAPTRR